MVRKKDFITSVTANSDNLEKNFISVVLLSDKAGKRMKSYGPTPLVSIKGKKLIDWQIAALKAVFKDFEIVIAGGFECEKVVKYVRTKHQSLRIRIVENQIYHHSNCCESLRLCINNISNDSVLIVNGDVLFNWSSLNDITTGSACVLYQDNQPSTNLEVGLIKSDRDNLVNLNYGITDKIWSEMLYLKGRTNIECLRSIVSSIEYKNKLLFEAISSMPDQRCKIKTIYDKKNATFKISNVKTLRGINS